MDASDEGSVARQVQLVLAEERTFELALCAALGSPETLQSHFQDLATWMSNLVKAFADLDVESGSLVSNLKDPFQQALQTGSPDYAQLCGIVQCYESSKPTAPTSLAGSRAVSSLLQPRLPGGTAAIPVRSTSQPPSPPLAIKTSPASPPLPSADCPDGFSSKLDMPSLAAMAVASPARSSFRDDQPRGQPFHPNSMHGGPNENSEASRDVDAFASITPLQTAIVLGNPSHRSLYSEASIPTSTPCLSRLNPSQPTCYDGHLIKPCDVIYSTKVPDRASSLQDEWLGGPATSSEADTSLDFTCDDCGRSSDSWTPPEFVEHCQGQTTLSPILTFPDSWAIGSQSPSDYPRQVASIMQPHKPASPTYSHSCCPTATALNTDPNLDGMGFFAVDLGPASPSRVSVATRTIEGSGAAVLTAGDVEPAVGNHLSLPSVSMRILPLSEMLGPQGRAKIDIRGPVSFSVGGGGWAGGQQLQQSLPGISHPQLLPSCQSNVPPGCNTFSRPLSRPSVGPLTSDICTSSAVSTLFDTCAASALNANYSPRTPNVYINGLPPHFPEDQLFAMVSPFGKVRSVRTFTREGRDIDSGYGFVLFETIAAAESCISSLRRYRNLRPTFCKQLHKFSGIAYAQHCTARVSPDLGLSNAEDSFEARMQNLQDPTNTNLYMEGLPLGIDQSTLAALVLPHRILSSRFFPTRLSNPPKTIAFARLDSRTGAEEIIQRLNGRTIWGGNHSSCRISVRFADTGEQRELRRHINAAHGERRNAENLHGGVLSRCQANIGAPGTSEIPNLSPQACLYTPPIISPPGDVNRYPEISGHTGQSALQVDHSLQRHWHRF